jgi:putative Ca2+/H+ antiporter (TMEM165/GDT1 family)
MDWKVFLATFTTIFLAEVGNKTHFAAIAASAQARSRLEVWLGVVLALALAGTLGVLGGKILAAFVNPAVMKYVSGGLFVAVGLWILLGRA